MNKRITKIVAAVLTGVMLLSLLGCAQEAAPQEAPKAELSVWSTYNTTKVIQQTGRNGSYQKMDAKLSVQMMKNEYEGAQLIVTADKDMTYSLTAGTLKNENGDTFPAENIAIYHQKYQTIKTNYNGDAAFQAGDSIPDMLLPLSIATAYGENTVAANNNQGITVEFDSAGVPAGIYTGSFTLDLDGKTQDIPVTVQVWDIEYEGRREFQSCFMIYRDELIVGEYSNTDAVVDAYIDVLMRYKTNAYVVRTYNSPEKLAEDVQKHFQNNNFNSIPIPVDFQLDYRAYIEDQVSPTAQSAVDYIKALVKISTPENNYIEYAYFYPSTYDEADVVEGRWDPSGVFLKEGGEFQKTLQLAVQQLKEEGWFDSQSAEFAEETEYNILSLPAVFTNVNFVEDWVGELDATFCPYLSLYNDTATLNRYQDAALENSYGDLWAYTCSGPINPYPTFHIDDGTLDMRVCGWMEKAYDVTGYLYYKVNNYALINDASNEDYIDLYATPARYYEVNGDGFLLYPGRYYGSDEPFASVRLAAYRDGMDDYDMLCVYEKLLEAYAEKNSLKNFDFKAYVDDLYHSLFAGVVAKQDDSLLYKAREELANRILTLKNEGKLTFDPASVTVEKITSFADGKEDVVIKSEYKDKGEDIGSKTKMFRPSYSAKVSSMADAKTLQFSYTNTGTEDITMQITLVDGSGVKTVVDTSYCGAGKTRDVKLYVDELDVKLADIAEVRLAFDNVTTNEAGQVVLVADKTFTVTDFYITK